MRICETFCCCAFNITFARFATAFAGDPNLGLSLKHEFISLLKGKQKRQRRRNRALGRNVLQHFIGPTAPELRSAYITCTPLVPVGLRGLDTTMATTEVNSLGILVPARPSAAKCREHSSCRDCLLTPCRFLYPLVLTACWKMNRSPGSLMRRAAGGHR